MPWWGWLGVAAYLLVGLAFVFRGMEDFKPPDGEDPAVGCLAGLAAAVFLVVVWPAVVLARWLPRL